MRRKWDKVLLVLLVLSLCVGCDQTTKRVAERTLKGTPVRSMLGDTIRLQYVQNTGAFLGFGARFPKQIKFWLFMIMPILVLFAMLMFGVFSRRLGTLQLLLLMLLVGGGIGNLIDRLFLGGKVTDFMNMGIGSLRTGIFNVADVAIMAGMFGLVFIGLWEGRRGGDPYHIESPLPTDDSV